MLAEKVMVAISRVDNIIDPSRQLPHEKPLKILADIPKEERLVLLTIPLHCFQYEAHCSAGRHDGHDGQDNKHAASKVNPPFITPFLHSLLSQGEGGELSAGGEKDPRPGEDFSFHRENDLSAPKSRIYCRENYSQLSTFFISLSTPTLRKYLKISKKERKRI